MAQIAVLGGGAWGTAMAVLWAESGHDVTLWVRNPAQAGAMAKTGRNDDYLPGAVIPPSVRIVTGDLPIADIVFSTIPTQHSREYWEKLPKDKEFTLVIGSKGIEIASADFLPNIARQLLPKAKIAVLAGPGFAPEIVRKMPTAYIIAAGDMELSRALAQTLSTSSFRLYASDDVVGASLGAVKNVIAIAAGIVEGAGMGDNTRAALITRGLAEISRLNNALGGKPCTVLGLAVVGDVVLSATSRQSRNYSIGVELGKGRRITEIMQERKTSDEGVSTVEAVVKMADRLKVDMPISHTLYDILKNGLKVSDAITLLMGRPLKEEA
ncbi:MAG: NAD(P)-dependent glycerol-3-phosphate dehydrogenase [Alphaproteobacteria bacterium]|nr:NAD(P)-dependent glycerol-3-phosphate dehydrogenase [Alphaproteobacteria bacterium]